MKEINVYDYNGEIVNSVSLKDDVELTDDRVAKIQQSDDIFYKGVGTNYFAHYVEEPDDTYEVIRKSDIFYLGYKVKKKIYEKKSGIFLEKYQPQFSDFIGTCGVKELSLLENSTLFEKSSVSVLESENWDKENNQYYFKVKYKCNRIKYLQRPQPKLLFNLIEYMIKEGWNFPWDKSSINDISYNCLVTDVADIFSSKDIKFQLGTVYSILYSLGRSNPEYYKEFLKVNSLLPQVNSMFYVFNSIIILQKFGIDIKPFSTYSMNIKRDYFHILKEYLIQGKNCGDCCYIEVGDKIREQYISKVDNQINKNFGGVLYDTTKDFK